ncbi:MAG: hypothetical protein M1820_002087 [Bogoriella megaspora]|nr:MAG: hypothetical protein M1820_002087 [Bogoriella megaspora]
MAATTQALPRPTLFDPHTTARRRPSLSSMQVMTSIRTTNDSSAQPQASVQPAAQSSPPLKTKLSKRGLRSPQQRKRNGTILHAIPGQAIGLMSPLEQRMATSPNAEILSNIGIPTPTKPSISPTQGRKVPPMTIESAKASLVAGHPKIQEKKSKSLLKGTQEKGKDISQPQDVPVLKSAFSPDYPENTSTVSPGGQHAPYDVDLTSFEPPPSTMKSRKPKIQVMIPKNKRPRPIFRKYSKDTTPPTAKKSYSPQHHSAHSGQSVRDLIPKTGALVPPKAAVKLGLASTTPKLPPGLELEALRTAPARKETIAQEPATLVPPRGPSPVVGPGEGRSYTLPSIPSIPNTQESKPRSRSKSKPKLSDERSLYEIPIPPGHHDPLPAPRPSVESTDISVDSEALGSDGGRISERTSMTSLDSKDVPDVKIHSIRRPGRTAAQAFSNTSPTRSRPSDDKKVRPHFFKNLHLPSTRGARLGEQMHQRTNSVPSPEKPRIDGASAAALPKRSLDERRPVLKRSQRSARLDTPETKAFSIPSPERRGVYDGPPVAKQSGQKIETKREETVEIETKNQVVRSADLPETQTEKKDDKKKKAVRKSNESNTHHDKPLPPPPPTAIAELPDSNKANEKNVFEENARIELDIRRTQSQLSPNKKAPSPPRRSHSNRAARNHFRHPTNSSAASSVRAQSRSRSRAGSRTRLDQLDRNFINASPKPDASPRITRFKSPTLSQAEFELEHQLDAITESPTHYFDHCFKTPEWEKTDEKTRRNSSANIPDLPLDSPKRLDIRRPPNTRKRSRSAPPVSPPYRQRSVRDTAIERQAEVSADAAEQIIVKIMANLGSLEDLFTTAIINKGFYRTFKRHELDLMKQVLFNASPAAWEHRELTPPTSEETDEENGLPAEDYSPTSYLGSYGQDLQIIGGLKALILERCQSVLRRPTADALASTDPATSNRMDAAFWRVWTFCILFGASKGREDDLNGQMDWLRGGKVAHAQTCTHSISGSESVELNSILLSPPQSFGKGNKPGQGLSAMDLYDMMELWTCLGALAHGLHGRTAQARQFGIFDDTEVRGGDVDGEEAMLEEWLQFVMSLGLDAVLGISSLAPIPGPDVFELAKEQNWTSWEPPSSPSAGGQRASFLREAVSRVYEERIVATSVATHPHSPASRKAVHRKMSHDRVAGFITELQTSKSRPSYKRLPPSDERPMSDWQGTSSDLGFGPPVPPIGDRPKPPTHQHTAPAAPAIVGREDRFGSVATVSSESPYAGIHGSPHASPQPLMPTVFGHGTAFMAEPATAPIRSHTAHPSGFDISPTGAPRINSAIPSSPLPLPPMMFGDPSPLGTPPIREVPAVLRLDLGNVEPVGTAERAVQHIVHMGFGEEDAKRALRMTDIGDGLRVDRALEMLLRE